MFVQSGSGDAVIQRLVSVTEYKIPHQEGMLSFTGALDCIDLHRSLCSVPAFYQVVAGQATRN